MELEFSQQIFEKIQISNFIKIRPAEAELFYVTGTDRHDEANIFFSHFGNAPKNITQF